MLYHFDIALECHAPMAPRDKLQTIEAASPEAALDLIAQHRLGGEPGLSLVWLRVVVSWNANGTPRQVKQKWAEVRPIALDN